ncbi:hypothetical protein, partial [Bulleidia sp. HCP3S3_C9]|uniref:hypothetical protein n=2 Tax=Bulleidia TaxID=118747 RepID=UPI003F8A6FAF
SPLRSGQEFQLFNVSDEEGEEAMIADEAIRLVEFIRENEEDRYEYLSSSIEELASGISDMKRMLELVLDELEKHGIDIKDRQEYKDDCLPF